MNDRLTEMNLRMLVMYEENVRKSLAAAEASADRAKEQIDGARDMLDALMQTVRELTGEPTGAQP